MQNFGTSMLWYWICYTIVTIVGIMHTIFNIYVLKMKTMTDKDMGEAYERTKPYHPLYNIILFPIFGLLYLKSLPNPSLKEAIITGVIWVLITIVFDLFAWVIIKHPWSLTYKGFYIDYQPWITLIYISIFAGPIIAYFLI